VLHLFDKDTNLDIVTRLKHEQEVQEARAKATQARGSPPLVHAPGAKGGPPQQDGQQVQQRDGGGGGGGGGGAGVGAPSPLATTHLSGAGATAQPSPAGSRGGKAAGATPTRPVVLTREGGLKLGVTLGNATGSMSRPFCTLRHFVHFVHFVWVDWPFLFFFFPPVQWDLSPLCFVPCMHVVVFVCYIQRLQFI
jgi:hypothetical protein